MVIRELLQAYREEDLKDGILILSRLLDVDKSYIYTHIDQVLDQELLETFSRLMGEKNAGVPINYLLKEREFMGLKLFVDRGVLIPRADTETLVEYLIDYVGDRSCDIFEIGVGSGAISIALGHYLKQARILGVDISPLALEVARKNLESFGLANVSFQEGDLFQGIEESFDVIVSNPPYIKTHIIEELDRKVKDYEPRLALDGGETGLDFYEKITRASGDYLRDQGLLIFEIGYDQGQTVSRLLQESGFVDIRVLKDLPGHDRVVMGTKGREL